MHGRTWNLPSKGEKLEFFRCTKGSVKNESFLQTLFLFWGIGKNAQEEQTEHSLRFCVACGFPTAYKGTPSSEVCL